MSGSRDNARDRDDREAIDRAFAEMMANYHLTSDRPDPLPPLTVERDSAASGGGPAPEPSTSWADNHPLFFVPEPPAGRVCSHSNV